MKTQRHPSRTSAQANRKPPLLVAHVLYSFGIGGLEKGIATVINHGSGRFRHAIVCLGGGRGSRALLDQDVELFELHKPSGNSPRFILGLARLLRRLRPDLVHTRNWGGMDGVLAARLAGIRNVVHGEHGWDVSDPFGANPKRLLARRLLSPWVREYTCVSRQMEEWLRDRAKVGGKPVTQIYNGIDPEKFSPGPDPTLREKLGIKPQHFVIGTVSRLDPIKDHETLFAAFDRCRRSLPAARLLVVGDGPRMPELRRHEGNDLIFLGERRDVAAVLRCFDLFALTSRNEGISNTILEAMATGLPVVATRVGGNSELVQDEITGCLVPAENPEAIAQAFLDYAGDRERMRAHGRAGRIRAETRFSIETMVRAYETVWARVAGIDRAPENGRS